MAKSRLLRVSAWGSKGVNLVETPLLLHDEELTHAQNAELPREEGEPTIRKRLGMAGFTSGLATPVHSLYTVPLPAPEVEPEPEGSGVYWYGIGRLGTIRDEAGVGVTDVAFPGDNINLSYVSPANSHDGWVYYSAADLRRWNGVTDEVWITGAALAALTNFGKSGWGPVAWTVDGDGIHVLVVRSEYAAPTRTYHAGVVLFPWADPENPIDNSALFTASLNTTSPSGLAVYPGQDLAIVDGAYFTGSDLQRGTGSAIGDERKRIYTVPVGGGGSWTTDLLLVAETGGMGLVFVPSQVTERFLVGDGQLWYGQQAGNGDQHLHLYRRDAAGTWTQIERMTDTGWEYFPMYVGGGRVLVSRTMTVADPKLKVIESDDGGETWETRLEETTNPIYTFGCSSHAYLSGTDTLRFAIPVADQRRVYSLQGGVMTLRYANDDDGDGFFYRGMLITP